MLRGQRGHALLNPCAYRERGGHKKNNRPCLGIEKAPYCSWVIMSRLKTYF